MRREEIKNLMEQIKDMRNQIRNLYYDALSTKNEFDTDSEEWDKIDRAMDSIKDASDNEVTSNYDLSETPGTLTISATNVPLAIASLSSTDQYYSGSTLTYMRAVAQYSYVFASYLIPKEFTTKQNMTDFMEQTEWGKDFDKYSSMIFFDAIESVARIWLHVWMKYKSWLKE